MASLISAWQGWTAYKTHQDSLRVALSIDKLGTSDGLLVRSSWQIRNNGRGDVIDPTFVITLQFRKESTH
ncbi:hypothetical protein [Cryobacterium sp. N19]|uniref:hypothetical protein n=1 Tax=Cryobacterium sp. N19 TaxID=2048288 RepID=UPI00112515D3|nr:hypothetical protein [Cryobacterium sp. N19]